MPRFSRRHLAAAACTVASLALAAYALRSALQFDSVNLRAVVPSLTDAAEVASRRMELAGTFATGNRTGDRVIKITTEGRIEFSEVGRQGGMTAIADTFTLGRRGKQLCLLPREGDLIVVVNLSTLVYYRDTYRRK